MIIYHHLSMRFVFRYLKPGFPMISPSFFAFLKHLKPSLHHPIQHGSSPCVVPFSPATWVPGSSPWSPPAPCWPCPQRSATWRPRPPRCQRWICLGAMWCLGWAFWVELFWVLLFTIFLWFLALWWFFFMFFPAVIVIIVTVLLLWLLVCLLFLWLLHIITVFVVAMMFVIAMVLLNKLSLLRSCCCYHYYLLTQQSCAEHWFQWSWRPCAMKGRSAMMADVSLRSLSGGYMNQ